MQSILQPKKQKTTRISIKVSPTLAKELKNLDARIDKVAPDLHFDADAVCAGALTSAIKKANKELEGLNNKNTI